MAKPRTLSEKLFGAAVLKVSFQLRDASDSAAFKGIYPGVLRDLGIDNSAVDDFIAANRDAVEKAARGKADGTDR